MHFEYQGIGHPTRKHLASFAEALLDEQATVSAAMAAHLAGCSKCAGEVQRIRASLELVEMSRPPEPSRVLTQEIVLRARAELNRRHHGRNRQIAVRAAQFAVCASAALVLAFFSFATALNEGVHQGTAPIMEAAAPAKEPAVNAGSLLQRVTAIKALAGSLSLQEESSDSPWETGYRRALEMLDHDLNAALSALQRNPGSARANQVMLMSLERQLEGLRDLYLDRTF